MWQKEERATTTFPPPPSPLTTLPLELLYQIADYLPGDALYNFHLTTPSFYILFHDWLHPRLLEDHSSCAGTALLWACENGHLGLVRYLLNHRLHNAEYGNSCIANAPCGNPFPLPDDLISHNDLRSGTPLIAVARADRSCIVRIYCPGSHQTEYANRPGNPLLPREQALRLEIVRLLLIRGVHVNSVDEHRKTALHYAAEYGETEICQLLLSCGADPAIIDYGNNTPLHLAVYNSRVDTVRALLSFEAVRKTINALTEDDHTALTLAAQCAPAEIVEMLLVNTADYRVCNFAGDTPLLLTSIKARADVMRLLIGYGTSIVKDPRGFLDLISMTTEYNKGFAMVQEGFGDNIGVYYTTDYRYHPGSSDSPCVDGIENNAIGWAADSGMTESNNIDWDINNSMMESNDVDLDTNSDISSDWIGGGGGEIR